MPTTIPHYHRDWVARRRAAYFKGKQCAKCGSRLRLELDHKDPKTKVHHAIWSWSPERQVIELAKCQILCYRCHKKKSAEEEHQKKTGIPNLHARKLTNTQIKTIATLQMNGWSERTLAARFHVSKSTIHKYGLGSVIRTQDLVLPRHAD